MSRYASIEAAQAATSGPVVKAARVPLRCDGCKRSFTVDAPVLIGPCEWAQCGPTESPDSPDDVRYCPNCDGPVWIRRAGAMCHP